MNKTDVQKLQHGLYLIEWKEEDGGGTSMAAVGSKHNGQRWICCTNWTSSADKGSDAFGDAWEAVETAELICADNGEGKIMTDTDVTFEFKPGMMINIEGIGEAEVHELAEGIYRAGFENTFTTADFLKVRFVALYNVEPDNFSGISLTNNVAMVRDPEFVNYKDVLSALGYEGEEYKSKDPGMIVKHFSYTPKPTLDLSQPLQTRDGDQAFVTDTKSECKDGSFSAVVNLPNAGWQELRYSKDGTNQGGLADVCDVINTPVTHKLEGFMGMVDKGKQRHGITHIFDTAQCCIDYCNERNLVLIAIIDLGALNIEFKVGDGIGEGQENAE